MRSLLAVIALSGCTLWESSGTAGDPNPERPDARSGAVLGRHAILSRTITSKSCPDSYPEESTQHALTIESLTMVMIDNLHYTANVTDQLAREADGDAPNVSLVVSEEWTSSPSNLPTTVIYDLWVDAVAITGKASLSFFDRADCRYTWRISAR